MNPYGYSCITCGLWVQAGTSHTCNGSTWTIGPPTIAWVQTGWKCPTCNVGVAPFMPYCPHCAPTKDKPDPNEPKLEE